ncbi:MAG: alpha/beta hydrolase [Desulfobacteraceae bacterium]|nr:MAG: alpha/beta hydrolase [Desulfobacteraceae bacterium]
MADLFRIDYTRLDRPEVLRVLFHPRGEVGRRQAPPGATDVLIPTADGCRIGGTFHTTHPSTPNLLFFHGNGEIAADYDDLGPIYNRLGLNFLAVDYRGYGRSTGSPTITAMMQDCHAIFAFTCNWLTAEGFTGPVIVMGRSLGSASALELASRHKERIAGLVVESGFAFAAPLLRLLGIDPQAIGFNEADGFGNIEKIRDWNKPALIIHAEFDHIIAFSEGEALYHACPSPEKRLLKIPGADHNDILYRGFDAYLSAVKELADRTLR